MVITTDRNAIFIVYPERRWVTAEWIAIKYADAVDNGDVDRRIYHGALTTKEMANALDDAGIITQG